MSLATPFDIFLMEWDHNKERLNQGKMSLHNLLSGTSDFHCIEPRDRVFALLNLCTKLNRHLLKIDYSVSIRWLMAMLCKYQLIRSEIFDPHGPLRLLQNTKITKSPLLPSWVPDYTTCDDDSLLQVPPLQGFVLYKAGADNRAWTALGLPPLQPIIFDHYNSMHVSIEDKGSSETLVLTGILVDTVRAAFRAPCEDVYRSFDPVEDKKIKNLRNKKIMQAAKEWDIYVNETSRSRDPDESTCGRYDAFWRTLITDRDLNWYGPPDQDRDFARRFGAWISRDETRVDDHEFILPYREAAV